MNYNFFTGGASYADVFARFKAKANAGAAELAVLFAQGNQAELYKLAGHPTTGSAMAAARTGCHTRTTRQLGSLSSIRFLFNLW